MEDEAKLVLETTKEGMIDGIKHLEKEYVQIRAGKSDVRILDDIKIDYYGTMTPLSQASNVSAPDAKTIMIQPWDKSLIAAIEKAIMVANLGFTPANNGEIIRISIPPLTEERRRELVKRAKEVAENAKVSIRGQRRSANDELKKMQKEGLSEDNVKDYQDNVQNLHDKYIKEVDDMAKFKEDDIMII
ncbi:MAG: ribosome recycling factor [Bacteroidota bacterium]|nr:ribosome recycling factor [Bacteroidota bacterium]